MVLNDGKKLSSKKNHKEALQDVILEEQGYICAYCNRRIHKSNPEDDEQLRMDHIDSKDRYPNKTFDYYNLIGCCYGDQREKGRISPPRSIHCDVSKDSKDIPHEIFPTNLSCEQVLIYSSEGEISSKNSAVNSAINTVLNLNCEKLIYDRKKILRDYVDIDIAQGEAEQLVVYYLTLSSEKEFMPYCGVIIGYLRQNYILNL
ncbi:MAG: retron system putative HNH endonuclease [Saprospiraceae bacterium]|nr:retron system putative HNH endonuclease [Saprospiraceae bacterium]